MKKDPLYKSFGYAFQGIFNTIRTERNIKIHCAAAILVTIFGIWLQISKTEWMICSYPIWTYSLHSNLSIPQR
ncbi:MAG: diacylglycerol kinase family protein [Anaerobutyricum sp.]